MQKPPTAASGSSTSPAVLPLLLLILIDAVGFAMLTPLLAVALAPESSAALAEGTSEDGRHLIYGFATGLFPMVMFFSAPILGQLSDRVGRKTILLVCAGGIILSYATIWRRFRMGLGFLVDGRKSRRRHYRGKPADLARGPGRCLPAGKERLLAKHGTSRIVAWLRHWAGPQRISFR